MKFCRTNDRLSITLVGMTPELFVRLLEPSGQAALERAKSLELSEARLPAAVDRLAREWPRELAAAAVQMAYLRRKAQAKFPQAEKLYFTREGLEMASAPAVAELRAKRFHSFGSVVDLGCGIGSDAMAFAQASMDVVAVDQSPLHASITQANLQACQLPGSVQTADLTTIAWPGGRSAFADPGRRPGGNRVLRLQDTEPSLDAVRAAVPPSVPLAVKVAPGADRQELRQLDAERHYISYGGELKECCLWFGALATARLRATLLPSGAELSVSAEPPRPPVDAISEFLLDPDPAIRRGELLAPLADQVDGWSPDAECGLLTAEHAVATPFGRWFRVEATLAWSARKVGDYLRSAKIGRITPIKRGSSVDVDAAIRWWKLPSGPHRVLFWTHSQGEPVVVVTTPIDELSSG
jgi:SAM-dependent methyltransferase